MKRKKTRDAEGGRSENRPGGAEAQAVPLYLSGDWPAGKQGGFGSPAKGHCQYTKLAPIEVEFHIWADGYLPQGHIVALGKRNPQSVIKLTRERIITGRLVDATSGQPVEGLTVTAIYTENLRNERKKRGGQPDKHLP